jgi:hypothetical protein
MKKLIALVAVSALALAACGTASTTSDTAGISVSGEGRVSGTPDLLTVTLGVAVIRPTVAQATAAATDAANEVIAALKAAGIADADMATSNYSVWPQYDFNGETQRLVGYQVQNTLTVKVRDLANSGSVIDAATAAAGDNAVVQGVSLSIDDTSPLVTQARQAAWADAVAKAQQLADLAGVSLSDKAISITETYTPSVVPVDFGRADGAGESTPILPGMQEVAVTIQVTFAIG